MAYEHVGLFDVVPYPCPNFRCGSAGLVHKIRSHLDVAAEDHMAIDVNTFGNLYKYWHLRIVNNDHVRTPFCARRKGSALPSPNTVGVMQTPLIQSLLLTRREAFVGVCHTLE